MTETHTKADKPSHNFRVYLFCEVDIIKARLHWKGYVLQPVKKFVLLTTIDNSSAYNYLGLG